MSNFVKKGFILFMGMLFLSGCATYKFQHGNSPYDKGYVASRDDKVLLEYTVGKDNTVPGIKLSKERFNRRKKTVEDYYKKMGVIQNHFTMVIWEPVINFWKLTFGVFRLPFIAVSDYRYEHNPKYREKIRQIEAGKDMREAGRINKLKDKLSAYIQKDLSKEGSLAAQHTEKRAVEAVEEKPIVEEEQVENPEKEVESVSVKSEEKDLKEIPEQKTGEPQPETRAEEAGQIQAQQVEEQKPAQPATVEPAKELKAQDEGLKAVIIAKPPKGNSPLRVKFNGLRSLSRFGKIVSYSWDFGDGEHSRKPKPINTYWSTTYGSRYFNVTLTVRDEKGNTATSSAVIEVLTK